MSQRSQHAYASAPNCVACVASWGAAFARDVQSPFLLPSAMIILTKRRPLWRVDTASHTPFIHTRSPVLPHKKIITYAKQRSTLVLVSPVIHRVGKSLGAMHISCRCCNVRVWMHGRSLSPVTPLVATRSRNVLFRFSHLSVMLRGRISTHDVPRPASKHT